MRELNSSGKKRVSGFGKTGSDTLRLGSEEHFAVQPDDAGSVSGFAERFNGEISDEKGYFEFHAFEVFVKLGNSFDRFFQRRKFPFKFDGVDAAE